VVHRIGKVSGATISAKPLPESARKEYFKGLDEKGKGRLDAAGQRFRKAVDEYPQYAAAWLELGRVQNVQNDVTSARQSFQHAISADPSLLPAYQELAQREAQDKDWQELAITTDQMLKLDAQNRPEFWFYNCVSKYHLGDLDAAEKSALEGIKIDNTHRVPKMEYVLGVILLQKGETSSAVEHLHKYLALNPNGPDAADAQKKLQDEEARGFGKK
jgi:tetratricopeptide (TPR) repeat protein